MKRTSEQIYREIREVEDKQKKEFAKGNARHIKAINALYRAMDKECKKHPERWYEIQGRYLKKIRKKSDEFYKNVTEKVANRYHEKLNKLFMEKARIEYGL